MSINTEIGRRYDYYKNLIVPNGCHFVVRLDGNCFSRFTQRYQRPFDRKFYLAISKSVRYLMENIKDIYMAHFHSDEVSLYFKPDSQWFNRRIEKITSITAGMMSSKFSRIVDADAHFDSRVLITPTPKAIEEYTQDRRLNALRGCVGSYSFYKLSDIIGPRKASKFLDSVNSKDRQEFLLKSFKIDINKVPEWQRLGVFFVWETYEKDGYNPITKKKVKALRKRIKEI